MAYRNPYKFRLWFSNQNTDLFNDRQKRMVYHFLSWGPRGCDSWNYKLMLEFHCSRRTLQYDLRHLEKHALIDIRGALGKNRRIIAIPYDRRVVWVRESCQRTLRALGAKFCTHQQRTRRLSINQQHYELLYGRTPTTFGSVGGGGAYIEQTRRKIIDILVHRGENREVAKNVANIICKKTLKLR